MTQEQLWFSSQHRAWHTFSAASWCSCKCTAFIQNFEQNPANRRNAHHVLAEAVASVQEVTSAKQRMEDAMQRVRSFLLLYPDF